MKIIRNGITIYQCECGREFTNSQSYNGYRQHCKTRMSEDEQQKDKEKLLRMSRKSAQIVKERFAAKKQQELSQ